MVFNNGALFRSLENITLKGEAIILELSLPINVIVKNKKSMFSKSLLNGPILPMFLYKYIINAAETPIGTINISP